MEELIDSINKAHGSARGPDDIHYQILKDMPHSSLEALLGVYNDVWDCSEIPSEWREATVIPIPKEGKDPTNPDD